MWCPSSDLSLTCSDSCKWKCLRNVHFLWTPPNKCLKKNMCSWVVNFILYALVYITNANSFIWCCYAHTRTPMAASYYSAGSWSDHQDQFGVQSLAQRHLDVWKGEGGIEPATLWSVGGPADLMSPETTKHDRNQTRHGRQKTDSFTPITLTHKLTHVLRLH